MSKPPEHTISRVNPKINWIFDYYNYDNIDHYDVSIDIIFDLKKKKKKNTLLVSDVGKGYTLWNTGYMEHLYSFLSI